MEDHRPQRQRLLKVFTARAHQGVVGGDAHPERLDLDELGEDVGGPVEQAAGEHGTFHALARGVVFLIERTPRLVEAETRHVQPVLDVVEEASCQRLDEPLLGKKGIGRNLVGLDPIPIVVDTPSMTCFLPNGIAVSIDDLVSLGL
jgi:hypothetical protein